MPKSLLPFLAFPVKVLVAHRKSLDGHDLLPLWCRALKKQGNNGQSGPHSGGKYGSKTKGNGNSPLLYEDRHGRSALKWGEMGKMASCNTQKMQEQPSRLG